MNREYRLSFGPRDLLHVASLVMRVRVWAELLRELPDDPLGNVESRRLAGALVHHADQHGWIALGEAAGAIVRVLCGALDAPALGRLRLLALRLERVANRGVVSLPRA
jgi:hypothetical protein